MRSDTAALLALAALAGATCGGPPRDPIDAAARPDVVTYDGPSWPGCTAGERRCVEDRFQTCVARGELTAPEEIDCRARGQACLSDRGCVPCRPGSLGCSQDTTEVLRCTDDGARYATSESCDVASGMACRAGACKRLCDDPSAADSNIGCEYYAVDLDNAVTGDGRSAASQQYAVVVSNPDPNLTARVVIERNDAPPGMPPRPVRVASAVIPSRDLEIFPLPAREVDCSAPGTFNTGSGTCLSSQAYRVTATIPVIAYQFNPLDNVGVFSNDASLLIPTNSVGGEYLVTGRPQTIATTSDPANNFDEDLRAFVAIVGTATNTHVRVVPTTNVIPGAVLPSGARPGQAIDVTLGPFDVLNLETGGFNADLTGSRITTDRPVAVFSGSEASDAPSWTNFGNRFCCADHAEEQLFPRRTAGTDYVAARMPMRSPAVRAAGGPVGLVDEPQWFRVLNAGTTVAHVTTTLPDERVPTNRQVFDLLPGADRTLRTHVDFEIHGDVPLIVSTVTGGQETTQIPSSTPSMDYTGLPGGDPSFIMIPPVQQWRQNYVFLTPDRYAFDFVTIVARPNARVELDRTPLPFRECPRSRADDCVDRAGEPACPVPNYVVYRCQLSFPVIVPDARRDGGYAASGRQADGVHIVTSDDAAQGVMVIVSGWDSYVAYGYPAGTQLRTVN